MVKDSAVTNDGPIGPNHQSFNLHAHWLSTSTDLIRERAEALTRPRKLVRASRSKQSGHEC